MTPLEQAAADLREAQANLKAHTPIETLKNAVSTAERALIAAASTPPAKPFTIGNGDPEMFIPDVRNVDVSFSGDEAETGTCAATGVDSDSIFEETEVPAVAASNVGPVTSAAMQDVVESVSAAAETIDATDEVSDEDVAKALA